jgi:hypothetical protein
LSKATVNDTGWVAATLTGIEARQPLKGTSGRSGVDRLDLRAGFPVERWRKRDDESSWCRASNFIGHMARLREVREPRHPCAGALSFSGVCLSQSIRPAWLGRIPLRRPYWRATWPSADYRCRRSLPFGAALRLALMLEGGGIYQEATSVAGIVSATISHRSEAHNFLSGLAN